MAKRTQKGLSTGALKKAAGRGSENIKHGAAGGDGTSYPLRVAKITNVDPKKLSVDLTAFTGNSDTYENVPLTFANAGARQFMGAIPSINDICVIGFSPKESGKTRQPYIVGWLMPGHEVGYDWTTTQLTDPKSVDFTPKNQQSFEGMIGRRRHKLRQMEVGNIVASSSQGSDLILSEDLHLANRRGNEILLRDSDQSLVVRTLQQFHAGSGFRVYSGMVQRDANLLPSQLFDDGINYESEQQLDENGDPIKLADLDPSENDLGSAKLSQVFNNKDLNMGILNPSSILKRGLFIDDEGILADSRTVEGAVYGGKNFYRVSTDGTNSVTDHTDKTFTEYRIEVSHTADGTLPVTEQTDGIDIDRLPETRPSEDLDVPNQNPLNSSINRPMVEMVMGTVVGNDPINDPESYGRPLIAQMYSNGNPNPSIQPAPPGTPISKHLAWLVTVRDPTSNSAPAFMGITKGGALKSFFPGKGSDTFEEFYAGGKITTVGKGANGISQKLDCQGSFEINATGSNAGNVGIGLNSSGAVSIKGEGFNLSDASSTGDTLASKQVGVLIETPHSVLTTAGKEIRLQGAKRISLEETNQIGINSNNSIDINTKAAKFGFETFDSVIKGDKTTTISGTYTEKFSSSPATGFTGGPVIERSVVYGGREESFKVGKLSTSVNTGSINFKTTFVDAPSVLPDVGPGTSINLSSGLDQVASSIDVSPLGISIETKAPMMPVTITSNAGPVSVTGRAFVNIDSSTVIKLFAPSVLVTGVGGPRGGVLTDGCKDTLTGKPFLLSGCRGVTRFRVN